MKSASPKRSAIVVILAVMIGAAPPALAHHSFAMYEPTKTLQKLVASFAKEQPGLK